MVPTDKPDAAFSMMGHFMANDHDWKNWNILLLNIHIILDLPHIRDI